MEFEFKTVKFIEKGYFITNREYNEKNVELVEFKDLTSIFISKNNFCDDNEGVRAYLIGNNAPTNLFESYNPQEVQKFYVELKKRWEEFHERPSLGKIMEQFLERIDYSPPAGGNEYIKGLENFLKQS